jgi:two-component system response regulator
MKSPVTVLVAEDDEDDLFLSKRVLAKAGVAPVFCVRDGKEAMDYLAGRGAYEVRADHPLPEVLLLDLKMPAFSGHEVLEWLRTQPELGNLKVYVLTSSDEPRDRSRAQAAGACGYFVKPLAPIHLRTIFPDLACSPASP